MVNNQQKHLRHSLLFLYEKDNEMTGWAAAKELWIVFGDDAPTARWCSKWLALFREGKKGVDDLEDEDRCGRPTEFDEVQLRDVVEQDPRVTIRELATLLCSTHSTVHRHLVAIGKVRAREQYPTATR